MGWQEIAESILSEFIVGIVAALISGVVSFLRGRKKGESISIKAVERKKDLYQPLLDELEKYTHSEWSIAERIKTPLLDECVVNSYKYALEEEVQLKMQRLYKLHSQFEEINVLCVVHKVVGDIFEKGYEELYGSVVDGIVWHEISNGDGIEQEVYAEPINSIRSIYDEKAYRELLEREGAPDDDIFIQDKECDEGGYVLIYSVLKRLYSSALNTYINGKNMSCHQWLWR